MSFKSVMRNVWGKAKKFFTPTKLAGIGVAAAGAFIPGLQPLIPLGTLILGSDFQAGTAMGTPIGVGAKRIVQTGELTNALTAEQQAELVEQLKRVASENASNDSGE